MRAYVNYAIARKLIEDHLMPESELEHSQYPKAAANDGALTYLYWSEEQKKFYLPGKIIKQEDGRGFYRGQLKLLTSIDDVAKANSLDLEMDIIPVPPPLQKKPKPVKEPKAKKTKSDVHKPEKPVKQDQTPKPVLTLAEVMAAKRAARGGV